MEQTIELFPGVSLRGVTTGRFKSACLSCSFLRPLCRSEAAKNALLANVLIQGTDVHPDLQSISQALDGLYGASLGPLVRKNGEIQTWGFYLSFLEDRFALEGDRVLEPMTELLGEVLLRPRLVGGALDPDYVERESCTNAEFYEKMRAAKGIPSTAAITPLQFCEKYCQYVDEGYTDVIHVPINRSGSSTYNNAVMAQGMLREERPEHHLNIHLLDPHTYSMVFGWYLCEMARKLQNGAELRHVISEFETQMNKMEVILGPYSLKQMKKSGRISAAAAVMGELMGIRPIITLIDGKTKVEAKVRGDDKVVPAMVELAKKRSEGVEDFDYMIGHTNIPQKDDLIRACRKAFGKDPLIVFPLGGVVSANTGPDTIALVYVGHPRG